MLMIGTKLKKLRDYLGYSQNELAKVLDVPQRTISNYEASNDLSGLLEYIIKVCSLAHVPLGEFFTDDDDYEKSLPPYIKPDDAALLKLINTALDENAQVELKKSFVQITKTLLMKKADKLKHLPEYKRLFGEE